MRIIYLTLALLAVSFSAEAKNFYTVQANVKLTYSNIMTGTETVIETRTVTLRYSNNDQNCLVFKDNNIAPNAFMKCSVDFNSGYVNLLIPMSSIAFWTEDKVASNILPSWKRVMRAYERITATVYHDKQAEEKRQLHDDEPSESFHITITFEKDSAI
jgi:hypothetical protein